MNHIYYIRVLEHKTQQADQQLGHQTSIKSTQSY